MNENFDQNEVSKKMEDVGSLLEAIEKKIAAAEIVADSASIDDEFEGEEKENKVIARNKIVREIIFMVKRNASDYKKLMDEKEKLHYLTTRLEWLRYNEDVQFQADLEIIKSELAQAKDNIESKSRLSVEFAIKTFRDRNPEEFDRLVPDIEDLTARIRKNID